MMSSTYNDEATPTIVDFGCSHRFNTGDSGDCVDDHKEHRGTGLTPAYCPPEVLLQTKSKRGHADITPALDMWSLGVIMYVNQATLLFDVLSWSPYLTRINAPLDP